MRASKESAELARGNVATIQKMLADYVRGSTSGKGKLPKKAVEAFSQLSEFVNVAKRKLPTEAAYERDAKRRKEVAK